jgi:phage pi2 protein 07
MTKIPQIEISLMLKKLSNGARDLLLYYYSRNDNWKFNNKNIAEFINTSERQVKKFRRELINKNFLLIQKGKIDVYIIGTLAVEKYTQNQNMLINN